MADPRTRMIQTMRSLCEEKNVDKISVSEITELAGVSRQTFYKYFQDKYDLALAVYVEDVFRKGNAGYRKDRDFKQMVLVILQTVRESPRVYQTLFRSADSQNSFMALWHEFSVDQVCNGIGRARVTPDLYLIVDAWTVATDKVFSDWVLSGMKEPEEQILEYFIRLTPTEIRQYLM